MGAPGGPGLGGVKDEEESGERVQDGRPVVRVLPGPETGVLAVKRPARPYKSAIQNRFSVGNAEGA